jgi:hypothetical protein
MTDKKISPRKTARRNENENRHTVNIGRVAALGIPAATSEHVTVRRDSKGATYQVTVTKNVRESKLLRTWGRSRARVADGNAREAIARAEDAAIAAELAETVR